MINQVWLYPEDTQDLIKEGVDLMMKTAIKLIGDGSKPKKELLDATASKDTEENTQDKIQGDQ
jgi:hypothetical protein